MAAAESESRSGLYASSIALSKDLLQRLMMDKCLQEESGDDGLREETEDDVELNLGLSLGGCHVKPKKTNGNGFGNLKPDLQRKGDGGSGNFGLQRKDSHGHGHGPGSGNFEGAVEFGFAVKEETEKQEEVPKIQEEEMLVQQKKREFSALRRQEARKKREERQQQRARREGGGGGGIRPIQSKKGRNGFVPLAPSYAPFLLRGGTVFPMRVGSGSGVVSSEEDKRVLRAQMASLKNKQRAAKESEPCRSDRKEVKKGDPYPSIEDKISRTSHEADNMVSSSNGGDHSAGNEVSEPAYAALPMSYSFPPQCMPVPMGMGFSFPYMIPYWPATPSGVDTPKSSAATPPLPPNVLQPVPTRAFTPFQMPVSQTSWYADPQTRRGSGTAHSSHASGASSGRSSSAVSEYESRSSQGASSNDTKSQSSTSSAVERERLQRASSISKTQDQTMASSEVSTASQLETLKVAMDKVPNNADQSAMALGATTMHENQMTHKSSSTKALQHGCASTSNTNNPEASKDGEAQGQCSLPSMPCVSTTGEGGKTISGFLYNYSKGEVTIVCVCHGTFLSPAGFVQHAGGTDIEHPERQIVVNPSLSAMQDTSATGEGI